LLGFVSADVVNELDVQVAFRRFRLRGEWFQSSSLVDRVIAMLLSSDESKVATAARWIKANNTVFELKPALPELNANNLVGAVMLKGCRCRCGHQWLPRDPSEKPRVCPKCKSPNWDRPKLFERNARQAKKIG
jgi:predicted Zn-ribbon and HTH transcriptional regulator